MRSCLSVKTTLYSKIKIFFNNRSSNAPTEPASERQEEVKDNMAAAGGSDGHQLIAAAVSATNENDSCRDGERAIADGYEGDSEGENENHLDALDLAA